MNYPAHAQENTTIVIQSIQTLEPHDSYIDIIHTIINLEIKSSVVVTDSLLVTPNTRWVEIEAAWDAVPGCVEWREWLGANGVWSEEEEESSDCR